MEIYHLANDIEVFGKEVATFPQGIDEAFKELISALPENDERPYYGISICNKDAITYTAAAFEKYAGEADAYKNYNVQTIEAGNYLYEPLYNWRTKTTYIKNVFDGILKDDRTDNTKPAIEIYLNEDKMLCMVKLREEENVFSLINKKADQLLETFNTAEEINLSPDANCWTPAQLLNHVTKSTMSVAQAMAFAGTSTKRAADKRVTELRQMFLDYSVQFKSAQFILPEDGLYNRQLSINAFKHAVETLQQAASVANLSEAIKHPAFGEITKLELLHFIVFHTQRHIRQLKKIIRRNADVQKSVKLDKVSKD